MLTSGTRDITNPVNWQATIEMIIILVEKHS